ncbi:MAG TPA: hypothetical protein VGF31_08110, partial [Myxococcaceae bacterium]
MKRLLSTLLLIAPLVASAQVVSTTPPVDQPPTPQPQAVPPPPPYAPPPPATTAPVQPLPQDDTYAQPAVPPSSEYGSPDVQEPLPPPVVAAPSTSGQWVYTTQYGWVWMPYGSAYTYLPSSAYPDMYVYAPAFGWRWVVAPWVWGVGPRPYFGVYGFNRFVWYGRGFGRWYGYRGGPVWANRGWYGSPAHRVYPGAVVRPAPYASRPGVVVAHPNVAAPRPGVVVTRPGGFARPGVVARP